MVTGSAGSGTGPWAADSEACGLPSPPPPHAASRASVPAASSGTIFALVRLLIEPLPESSGFVRRAKPRDANRLANFAGETATRAVRCQGEREEPQSRRNARAAEEDGVHYDVIVVGLGGMGVSSADALAGRGLRVLGLDQFDVGHLRGASHGRTRIVRMAYFESPDYIPLLRRAYALWDTFPENCRLHRVGLLTLGPEGSAVVAGATRSAAAWQIL